MDKLNGIEVLSLYFYLIHTEQISYTYIITEDYLVFNNGNLWLLVDRPKEMATLLRKSLLLSIEKRLM